jgi:hypothetical protein
MTMPKLQLIGITGKAGSGKDTIAKYIQRNFEDTYIEHFADPLKEAASKAFGIPTYAFSSSEFKGLSDPYWKVSPRQIAQFFGTEMFRETIYRLLPQIGMDFWVYRMKGKLEGSLILEDEGTYSDGETVLIPDVRFQNEVDFILSNNGVIITVTRSGYEGNVGISNHPSEAGDFVIPSEKHYLIQNDGDYGQLYASIERILPAMKANHSFNLTRI